MFHSTPFKTKRLVFTRKPQVSVEAFDPGMVIAKIALAHMIPTRSDATINQLFFNFADSSPLPISGLNTHRFIPEQWTTQGAL